MNNVGKILYNSKQNLILKYMSMRTRIGKPLVSIEEIMAFSPERIKRKDKLKLSLKSMVKSNFIKEKDGKYIITNVGKRVPYIVASNHFESLSVQAKRTRKRALKDFDNGGN